MGGTVTIGYIYGLHGVTVEQAVEGTITFGANTPRRTL